MKVVYNEGKDNLRRSFIMMVLEEKFNDMVMQTKLENKYEDLMNLKEDKLVLQFAMYRSVERKLSFLKEMLYNGYVFVFLPNDDGIEVMNIRYHKELDSWMDILVYLVIHYDQIKHLDIKYDAFVHDSIIIFTLEKDDGSLREFETKDRCTISTVEKILTMVDVYQH